jgi:eukaryotic-like serine/threonine-protein kinase
MDAERWTRVEQLCQAALERDEHEQAAFLASACGSDQELRREVESLLAHRDKADTFLEAGAFDAAAQVLAADGEQGPLDSSRLAGRLVGSYRIVAKVASGGMGDVYQATRADGTFDKQVAIKLIQGARSTDYFLSRFQNERQILATLDHPNIARLLDGGTTEEGLPYLVMEYIQGLPIDEFCTQKNLDIRERLELFRTVCSAVQFAHQNLVVHRDLKPSNILVTSDGVPKLLDFGIAKILNPADREDASQQTMTLMRMLTPDFASPEQVRNEPISTASDVYSLGVILYVLLTGQSPYRVPTGSPEDILKAICEVDPEKPSTASTRTSQRDDRPNDARSSSSESSRSEKEKRRKLGKILEGDLDIIVLKALRKEPQRRYASVDQFSEDIRRYLSGLPILAHKDTPGYRAHKFVGRHKWGVAAVALLIVSLAAGMITTFWQARIARAERARAERRFNDVRALASSLIFEVHDSIVSIPGATAARKLIVERAQQYLDSLAQEARNDPALLQELASSYRRLASVLGDARDANLGNTTKATEDYRKAVELCKLALALQTGNRDISRELATDYAGLSVTTRNEDEKNAALHEAEMLLEPLVASNPQDLDSREGLAKIRELQAGQLLNQKDMNPALEAYWKSLVLYDQLAKADPKKGVYQIELSFAHKHVGGVLNTMDRLDEAFEHYRQALAIDEAQLSAHPDDLNARFFITYTYSDTGLILKKRGDYQGALSYYRKALDIRAALAAADPKDTRAQLGLANTSAYISDVLRLKGDYQGALTSARESLRIRESRERNGLSDRNLSLKIAEDQGLMSQIYANMADQKNLSHRQRIGYCGESRKWFDLALPAYLRMQKEGSLPASDSDDIDEMKQSEQPCAAFLARVH